MSKQSLVSKSVSLKSQIARILFAQKRCMDPTNPLTEAGIDENKGVHRMKNSNVIGIDLAKHVIQVCKIDKHGELLSNKAISPSKLKELMAKSAPSIAAMEGCGACHYRARQAQ